MEKETIIFYLKYAMNYGKSVKIQTRNNKFIITPFRLQADILREQYGKERCGTIHTFQGKREKQVYVCIFDYLYKEINSYKQIIKNIENPYEVNNSHLDFAIYSESINKPLLAIEVDGKRHREEIQKERDKKKN